MAEVLVADRRPMNAYGLAHTIDAVADFTVKGCCHSQDQVAVLLDAGAVGAVVLDPELYGDDPLDAVRAVRGVVPTVLVLLTSSRISESMLSALSLSGVGCVSFTRGRGWSWPRFGRVVEGRPALPAEIQVALVERVRAPADVGPVLTPREQDVFVLAADGLTVSQIAQTLMISHSTTKTYLRRVYGKFGAANRSAAVAMGIRHGILREPANRAVHADKGAAPPASASVACR